MTLQRMRDAATDACNDFSVNIKNSIESCQIDGRNIPERCLIIKFIILRN